MGPLASPLTIERSQAFPAIAWATLIAGVLDISSAFVIWTIRRQPDPGPPRDCHRPLRTGFVQPRSDQRRIGTRGALSDRVRGCVPLLRSQPRPSLLNAARRRFGTSLRCGGLRLYDLCRPAGDLHQTAALSSRSHEEHDHRYALGGAPDRPPRPSILTRSPRLLTINHQLPQ